MVALDPLGLGEKPALVLRVGGLLPEVGGELVPLVADRMALKRAPPSRESVNWVPFQGP